MTYRLLLMGHLSSHGQSQKGSYSGGAGAEPANVLHSRDGGKNWQGSSGFRDVPSRGSWSFPVPPHEPHVLSIEVLKASGEPCLSKQHLDVCERSDLLVKLN